MSASYRNLLDLLTVTLQRY